MLNLFKSEKQIITEIHNEFDTAEDRLLQQADMLLTELNLQTHDSMHQKAERLNALGFVKSEPVTWVKTNSLVKTKEQADLIRYYKQNYPFQKFLTENELERICKKYNLVFAPVGSYIKDVPEKNLKEIESVANLKSNDLAIDEQYCEWEWDNSFPITGSTPDWTPIRSKWRKILPKRLPGHFRNQFSVNDYLNGIYNTGFKYLAESIKNITEDKQGLFIAAPQSYFDLKGVEKAGKFSFMNVSIVPVKDPIVFRYCRGGVQVLSKWGLEASDELLVNDINN